MRKNEIIYGSAISFALLAIVAGIYFLMRKKKMIVEGALPITPKVVSDNDTDITGEAIEVISDISPSGEAIEVIGEILPSGEGVEVIDEIIILPPESIVDIEPVAIQMQNDYGANYRKLTMVGLANQLEKTETNESLSWYIRRNLPIYSPLLLELLANVDKETAINEFLRVAK